MSTHEPIVVLDIENPDYEQVFMLAPRDAVLAAHAQSLGDYNFEAYGTRYGSQVHGDEAAISCGRFYARLPVPKIDLDTLDGPVELTVYDIDSGLGGSHMVEITADHGESVDVVVRYGRATTQGWEAWKEWDGAPLTVEKSALRNGRTIPLYRDVEFYRSSEMSAEHEPTPPTFGC